MEKREVIWVIGDIHGMLDPLKRLINHIRYREVYNYEVVKKIIFIGDYIDYGPSSKEVIDLILSLPYETVCLAGNHEDLLLHFYKNTGFIRKYGNMWFDGNGGEDTITSFSYDLEVIEKLYAERRYRDSRKAFRREDYIIESKYMDFFENLKYSHTEEIEQYDKKFKFAFVHAGLDEDFDVEAQLNLTTFDGFHKFIEDNKIYPANSNIWRRKKVEKRFGDYILIYGHTPTCNMVNKENLLGNFKPESGLPFITADIADFDAVSRESNSGSYYFNCNIDNISSIDIDTGAVYGKYLSAIGLSNYYLKEDCIPVIRVATHGTHRDTEYDTLSNYLFFRDYKYKEYLKEKQQKRSITS